MQRPLASQDVGYSLEQLAIFRQAQQLQALIGHEGWKLIDDHMGAMVADKMKAALHVQTSAAEFAADTLRQWQITDEVVSTIRSFINNTIDTATQLAPQSTIEEAVLQEQLHGRSSGDPAGPVENY